MSHADGHDEPCWYCKEPCDHWAANPGKWPLALVPPGSESGVVQWCCTECVMDRLYRLEEAEAQCAAMCEALEPCGTNTDNPDTCGVCHEHFGECEEEKVQYDDAPGAERFFACPGARGRRALVSDAGTKLLSRLRALEAVAEVARDYLPEDEELTQLGDALAALDKVPR